MPAPENKEHEEDDHDDDDALSTHGTHRLLLEARVCKMPPTPSQVPADVEQGADKLAGNARQEVPRSTDTPRTEAG